MTSYVKCPCVLEMSLLILLNISLSFGIPKLRPFCYINHYNSDALETDTPSF